MSLASEINAAFGRTAAPSAAALFETDSEGALEAFAGKQWQDIDPEVAHYHCFALTAFSPIGFAYYLPAFMLGALSMPNTGLVDATIDALSPPKNNPSRPSFMRRWERLSAVQKSAVVNFLRHFSGKNPYAIGAAIDALLASNGHG